MSYLPLGWTYAKLGELAIYVNGKAFKPKDWKKKGLPIIRIQNLNNPTAIFNYADPNHESKYLVKNGDLLVSWSASLGVYIWNRGDAWLNQHIFRVDFAKRVIIKEFLFYALKQTISDLYKKTHGTGMVHVTKGDFENHQILLPPLKEQHRIVAKLEKLLAKVDQAQARLEKIPGILKHFRKAVLDAACCGKLTADWRKNNHSLGAPVKLKTPDPQQYLDVYETSICFDLPETWAWVPFGKLGQIIGGGTPSKKNPDFWNGDIPWVSPKDMKTFRISDSIDHITEQGLDNSSAKLIPKSSILFVIRGMILNHTLPIALTESEVAINQDMKALVPEISEMSDYLLIASLCLSSRMLYAVKEATHGTRRIETDVLKNWAFPIPPLAEQKEIVKRVNKLFQIADQLESRYQKAKTHIDHLTQSILAKAFRGELVPQDPNDEPASELLKRIKAEKARQ
ncbi:MAG: restriction endonuclease subunit S, partial [Desulfobacterales bacterium]